MTVDRPRQTRAAALLPYPADRPHLRGFLARMHHGELGGEAVVAPFKDPPPQPPMPTAFLRNLEIVLNGDEEVSVWDA